MRVALCCTLLLLAMPALADGSIIGTVTDAQSKRPVAGVVVIATAPQLQGTRTVVTDMQGNYRLEQLPVGSYTLRFEGIYPGDPAVKYEPFTWANISVRLHRTLRFNMQMFLTEWLGG